MIRVLLVDDQQLVREGLHRILHPNDGFDIVGECADGDEVISAIERTRPDVILMDVRMKRVDGIEATRQVRALSDPPPILVLTTFNDDEVLAGALRAGAVGFQLKDAPGEDIARATRTVASGDAFLDPTITARVLTVYQHARDDDAMPSAALEQLTTREIDVLRLMAAGATNLEIADTLFVSEATVKSHIGHIFTKLELRDRAAAIVFAFDHGIVSPKC